MVNHEGRLCWVTALMAEAKPLIKHYRMKKMKASSTFPVFSDETCRFWLIVSGVGKTSSAAATASLFHAAGEMEGMAWLNFGIAGHRKRELGELRWVNKIEDAGTSKIWYPPRIFKNGKRESSALLTVDQPGDYPEGDILVDMETSGFYQIASRFSTRELVQSVKIVSDNVDHNWRELEKGKVDEWIVGHMDKIAAGAEELLVLSSREMKRCAPPSGCEGMLETWRFTETEKHLLRKILGRRQVMMIDVDGPVEFCREKEVKSAAEALKVLREELELAGDELIISI